MRTRGSGSVTPYLGLAVAVACGGSGHPGVSEGARDGGGDTTAVVHDSGPPTSGLEAGPPDSSAFFFPDATSEAAPPPDAAACMHLNIGILGNPGQNASSDFQQWLVNAGTSVQRIQTMAPTPPVTAATLQPFDVVILDWLTRDYSAAEAAVLASFVSAGGGVVSMSGYDNVTADDWHANSLLAPLAVAYSGPLLVDGPVTDFAMHPITAGLTSVTFDGGYAITDLGGTSSTRTPIAFLANPQAAGNVPVAYAIQAGSGHAFVWGDEWISFDSEWSTMPEIEQLWVQVFAWVSPMNRCALQPPQ
jgi:hypothetical protein